MTTKTWTVQVTLDEDGDDTRANAALSVENKMELRGRGVSRRNPHDESEDSAKTWQGLQSYFTG